MCLLFSQFAFEAWWYVKLCSGVPGQLWCIPRDKWTGDWGVAGLTETSWSLSGEGVQSQEKVYELWFWIMYTSLTAECSAAVQNWLLGRSKRPFWHCRARSLFFFGNPSEYWGSFDGSTNRGVLVFGTEMLQLIWSPHSVVDTVIQYMYRSRTAFPACWSR